MTTNGAVGEKTPLSVLLFQAAMNEGKSVSEYAEQIHVGAISLRQFLLNKTQRPRTKTLEQIGDALNMPMDEVRRRMDLLPETTPPFGEWLQARMSGKYSRAGLSKATKISDGALKNYLTGQTLPDSEQAQKIVNALDLNPLETARVIVANMVVQSGGSTAEPEPAGAEAGAAGEAEGEAEGEMNYASYGAGRNGDEDQIMSLWRKLHPQGRRATIHYIAGLLAEG